MEIHRRPKVDVRSYNGSKPDPQDWADLLEEDPDLVKEFSRLFNNKDIPEADLLLEHHFTPEVLRNIYLNMGVSLPRDSKRP